MLQISIRRIIDTGAYCTYTRSSGCIFIEIIAYMLSGYDFMLNRENWRAYARNWTILYGILRWKVEDHMVFLTVKWPILWYFDRYYGIEIIAYMLSRYLSQSVPVPLPTLRKLVFHFLSN